MAHYIDEVLGSTLPSIEEMAILAKYLAPLEVG